MTFGLFMICLGILFLLNNLGFAHGHVGRFILPLFIIFVGGSLIIKGFANDKSGENDA